MHDCKGKSPLNSTPDLSHSNQVKINNKPARPEPDPSLKNAPCYDIFLNLLSDECCVLAEKRRETKKVRNKIENETRSR